MKNYRGKPFETDFKPCPRCGSEFVEWTNSRDLNILSNHVYCIECGLTTFEVETMAFMSLPNFDYESSLKKYNAWVATRPREYHEDKW